MNSGPVSSPSATCIPPPLGEVVSHGDVGPGTPSRRPTIAPPHSRPDGRRRRPGQRQARIGTYWEDAQAQGVRDEAGRVLDALRTAGWKPVLRIKDIEITRAGPLPGRDPAQSAGI